MTRNPFLNFVAVLSLMFALGQREQGMFVFTLFISMFIIVFAFTRPKTLGNRRRKKSIYYRIKESFNGSNHTIQEGQV